MAGTHAAKDIGSGVGSLADIRGLFLTGALTLKLCLILGSRFLAKNQTDVDRLDISYWVLDGFSYFFYPFLASFCEDKHNLQAIL